MPNFKVCADRFELDGKPFQLIAGAIHYFRVPREYWRDRLLKLKACGFNAVETYVAWNAHMPSEDVFDTSGMLDIGAFLSLAQELGLYAIVRPGPYICSEWEFGGLPWWLLKYDCALRCMDRTYIRFVDQYLDHLIPVLLPHLCTRGGNVLMLQVENEYGSYGDDKEYLAHLRDGYLQRGVDVPLFTSDGDCKWMLTGGTLCGTLPTVNFGSDPESRFEALKPFKPFGPLMCSEYWNGWFDHWGEAHHTRDAQSAAEDFKKILALGASVSVYMFHGGSNFGYMNGANCPDPANYQPTVSSYDDDALLTEDGSITPKYRLFQKALMEILGNNASAEIAPSPKAEYGLVQLSQSADVLDYALSALKPTCSASPLPMEKLDQGYGFTLYSCRVSGPREEMDLRIDGLRDRAQVFVDGRFAGVMYRNDPKPTIRFAVPQKGVRLDILVENMGRVNYGPYLRDPKGILYGVRLGQQFLYGWEMRSLLFRDLSGVPFSQGAPTFSGRPLLLRGAFDAGKTPCDTFVHLPGFKKGMIFVNGKPLSRHWEIGPQRSAYLPAPFLRPGMNTLEVLELEGFDAPAACLRAEAALG